MATRTYTRPADPINTDDLAASLSTLLSKTVTVAVTPTNAYITGTITSGDDTTIQNAITAYAYTGHAGDAGFLSVDDGNMSTASHSKASSQHAAYAADLSILAVANSKTAVRFWDSGTFQNGSPNTGDMIIFTDSGSIVGGSGVATFYLTTDHTSAGTALCSAILVNSVRGSWVDDQANYNPGTPTVDASKKYVTVKTTKQSANGLTLLSTTVLGSITFPSAPNSTTVTLFAIGISV